MCLLRHKREVVEIWKFWNFTTGTARGAIMGISKTFVMSLRLHWAEFTWSTPVDEQKELAVEYLCLLSICYFTYLLMNLLFFP